jgi:ankyrin repeat protein
MLKYLISIGGSIQKIQRQSKSGISLFHAAAQNNHSKVLAFLKHHYEATYGIDRLDMNRFQDIKGCTPLHWACAKGAEDVLQYLLAWGCKVNHQDQMGISPLHLAVKRCDESKNVRMVRFLLIRGANKHARDQFGRRAIDIAQECKILANRKELLSYLVKKPLFNFY